MKIHVNANRSNFKDVLHTKQKNKKKTVDERAQVTYYSGDGSLCSNQLDFSPSLLLCSCTSSLTGFGDTDAMLRWMLRGSFVNRVTFLSILTPFSLSCRRLLKMAVWRLRMYVYSFFSFTRHRLQTFGGLKSKTHSDRLYVHECTIALYKKLTR